MGKENCIINIINEIEEILLKNKYTENRYQKDIEWFKKRRKIYEDNIIRVAIMGITSSGKSTLVNGLLGEKILPMAIRPSSNIIITASKGEKRQGKIYFKNGNIKVLEGNELNEINISRYADEIKNSNNNLDVVQIDIITPRFALGENIHIIDSPGLDAWNLENHEKLTLEILLPTIDICLFVTTVKASSDAANFEKIKIVNEKEKQIILVQNMIDSIEEKIGKNGIVEEDKNTILKKYKKRAEKILKEINTNEETGKVVQISALNGLNGIIYNDKEKYEKSNFKTLIKEIENCSINTMPKINKQRALSMIEKIHSIIRIDDEIIRGNDLDSLETLVSINNTHIDSYVEKVALAKEHISEKIIEMENVISNNINEISNKDSENVEDYLDIVDKINLKNLYIQSDILNIVRKCEREKNKIYTGLNLDIKYSYIFPSMDNRNLEIKHKYEERTMLFKKDGVLNRGKRLLSNIFDKDWGYKEIEYDERIVDKEETIKTAEKICNENKNKYVSLLKDWNEQLDKSINLFFEEVSKREYEYLEKKEQNIEIYDISQVNKNLLAITEKLKNIRGDIGKEEVSLIQDNYIKTIKYPIKKFHYNLYMITNEIFEKNYFLIESYINNSFKTNQNKKVFKIFWTCDIDSCKDFVFRFMGIRLKEYELKLIYNSGIFVHEDVVIILDLAKIDFKLNNIVRNHNCNMFIVFNGMQIGSSRKHILESKNLKEFFKNNSCSNLTLNLVIDSCKEFINADNIEELLIEVNSLKFSVINRFNNIDFKYILINSKNPIYNMALIEAQNKKEFLISDYKIIKEKLFENYLSRGKEEKETLEKILNYFLNNKTEIRV